MRTYLANMPAKIRVLILVPAVLAAYPIVRLVGPVLLHAVVPDVVRNLFHLI